MIQVIPVERKPAVLTPSSLACLAHTPTVNLTAGCAHECRYCYARGYLTHPGEGNIRFYTNTFAKLREELRRKRKKPTTVYFSPSSDPFQPVPEVLDMAYDVFRFLLESEIGVAFVTKGRIPERHRNLLAAHAPLVQGRIGLISLDPGTAAAFEPHAATPEVRLAQAAELIGAHVAVEARLDPILPGVTDATDCLEPLCAALARIGVRRIAASPHFSPPPRANAFGGGLPSRTGLGRGIGGCRGRGEGGLRLRRGVRTSGERGKRPFGAGFLRGTEGGTFLRGHCPQQRHGTHNGRAASKF